VPGNRQRRRGLTLIEVLIALVVTSVVVLTGRQVAEQVAGAARTNLAAVDARLATISEEEELRRSLRLARAPLDSSGAFDGGLDRMEWSSRCTVTRGWDEPCRCTLRVAKGVDSSYALRSCDSRIGSDTLLRDGRGIAMLFLADAVNGGRWYRVWGRASSVPFAVGFVRFGVGDTVIVRVGTRG
jgi:prepilin-type N-terminal cleavage/methylation domain-containing protein